MLFVAVLLTAALCAVFALLPARARKRGPCRADLAAGVVVFGSVWAAAFCIYAKPGLAAGFGAFRLLAITAMAFWAAGSVCALRCCGGLHGGKRTAAVLGALLFAAVGCEGFLCNAPFYGSHGYTPVDLSPYLAENADICRNPNGTFSLTEEQSTFQFTGIDQPLYNLYLNGLHYDYTGEYPQYQNPLFTITVAASDDASSREGQSWQWEVAAAAPRSLVRSLDLSGSAHTLTLRAEPYKGQYTWYSFGYTLNGITANVPRPFDFSAVRLLGIFLLLCAGWALRPKSALWREAYLANRAKYRPLALAAAGILAVLAVAAPFADPVNSGVATPTYNVNNWDGESRLYFTKHINEWQHDSSAQYGALAHSLLNGRLDLMVDPPQALNEMTNPYDTGARGDAAPDALWDVAYRSGRYYVYFGVVPCLLFQLPFEALTGVQDLPPAFGMIVMALLFLWAVFGLGKQALRRWFPRASAAAYLLCCTGIAASSGLYYLLLRASVYEYAILCGMSFVMLALWQWLLAANTAPERSGRIALHLALGSLCMALVAGCRPQMLLFAALAVPIFRRRYLSEKRLFTRRGARELAAFALPVLLVAAGLMWYNAARFGSPFDFGANYNLTSNDMTQRGFNVGRIAPALFTYFLTPPVVRAVFPYLDAIHFSTNYMGLTISELFYGGLLICAPLTWALAGLPLLRARLQQKRLFWPLCGVVGAALLLAALDCEMAGVLFRYLCDFSPVLLGAAALCALAAEESLLDNRSAFPGMAKLQSAFRAGLSAAVAAGAAYSFFLFFAAAPWLFGQNPALYQNVSRLLQFWL